MKKNKELSIGLFIVTIIIGAFFLINFLRGNNLFQGNNVYYTIFDNVEGLTPSAPIYINGYKAGAMEKINYQKSNNKYLISYHIKDEFSIPDDSFCEIYSADLLGSKALRISMGKNSKILNNYDTIPSNIQEDMLSSVLSGIDPLKKQASILLTNINESVIKINNLLNDESQKSVKSIIENVDKSLKDLKVITKELKNNSPQISNIISNIDTLTIKLDTTVNTINSSLYNIEKISSEINGEDIKKSISEFNKLIIELRNPNGSIGKLMSTDSLHNSIQTLANDLDSLVKKIEKNPKKFLKISVF